MTPLNLLKHTRKLCVDKQICQHVAAFVPLQLFSSASSNTKAAAA